jgi:putative peptidoglycan lipid II flippase
VLYKKGFRIKAPKSLRHPEALTIGRLMVPRVFSSCIYQLNNFVDSIFGSFAAIVGEGGVAVLYFSYRLIQFPLGVFSNAIFQAMLPTLSHQAAEKDLDSLKRTISFGLRSVFFVMLPAQVFFMVLAKPLINALFSGGKFDAYSVELTAAALFFYSIGLSAYGANKILQGAYFSLKDTVTPTKLAGLSLLLNIVLNYILMFPLKIGGIALATSVSGIISFGILLAILVKKVGDFGLKEVGFSFMRILAASIGMGAVCYCCIRLAHNRFIVLALTLSAGVISYAAFCLLLKVDEMRQLFGFLRKGMK